MEKKIIDTRAYVSALRDITRQGKTAGMRIAGNSMVPFLVHERDDIYFKKPDRPLKKGDMVFYQRLNGQFVMHRIYRITDKGIYTVGDAQTVIEGPLHPEHIFALIFAVRRKGKQIGPESFCWKFFQYIWIRMVPLRPACMKLYSLLHK